MESVQIKAGYWDVDSAEYHRDCSALSRTMMEVFRRSPLEFEARYIEKTITDKPSDWASLGIALHTLLLEPETFESTVAIKPDCDRRTKDGKSQHAEFLASCNGKTIISEQDNQIITKMVKSALEHPQVASLLKRPHLRERGIRWTDPETGMICKCRPDIFVEFGLVADLKSAADPTPEAWERSVVTCGYHRQQAHYSDGIQAAFGTFPKFLHIVIGKSEPYECCAYYLDWDAIELGQKQNRTTLRRMAECFKTEDFREPRNKEIQMCSLPRWAFQIQ